MRTSPLNHGLECLLIADDLTGACDSAVHFAARGRATTASLCPAGDPGGTDVLAVSTDTRDAPPAEFRRLVQEAARQFEQAPARMVFKKIDSLLRGNPGGEIRAAAEAFECQAAVITPAFPVMRRVVLEGSLLVSGGAAREPIHVPTRLREQGLSECVHTRPGLVRHAVEAGARYISVDAGCDEDLDTVVAEALATGRRLLWCGSGGLACALARALSYGRTPSAGDPPAHPTPVLFCLGSDHAVTLEQQRNLIDVRGAALLHGDTADPDCVEASLAHGGHIVLRIPRGMDPERLRELVKTAKAVLISGGDTASAVCRAAGSTRISLNAEILPGIPRGVFAGGALDGVAVATKSGAFGEPGALVDVADYFTCLS